jgi:glucan-binding YG repeat protein
MNNKYYLVLAKYKKSRKTTWWTSSTSWMWTKGKGCFMPGTMTEVDIVDVIEVDEATGAALTLAARD